MAKSSRAAPGCADPHVGPGVFELPGGSEPLALLVSSRGAPATRRAVDRRPLDRTRSHLPVPCSRGNQPEPSHVFSRECSSSEGIELDITVPVTYNTSVALYSKTALPFKVVKLPAGTVPPMPFLGSIARCGLSGASHQTTRSST